MTPNRMSQLSVLPFTAILIIFTGLPLLMVLLLSFWAFDGLECRADFTLANFAAVFASPVTWKIFANTLRYSAITWAITLVIGFTVSFYRVFHVRNLKLQIGLFLLCTIPFWTSTVSRMISWIPFLGREGLFNAGLMQLILIHQPFEFMLFSGFSVIPTYVNLFPLFMIVPIFNAMAKIDKNAIEAALDAGATGFQIAPSPSR